MFRRRLSAAVPVAFAAAWCNCDEIRRWWSERNADQNPDPVAA